jgi:hypothetical protein
VDRWSFSVLGVEGWDRGAFFLYILIYIPYSATHVLIRILDR